MARNVGFGRFATRRQGPRRATEWSASADVTGLTTLSAGGSLLDQSFTQAILADVVPATITRTVGFVTVRSDQIVAAEPLFGAVGFAVVSEQARAVGVTALPTPITEEPSDLWFAYQYFTGFGGTVHGAPLSTFHFDSRAQRKVVDGEAIVVMIESAVAGFAMEYAIKFRMLFKLH